MLILLVINFFTGCSTKEPVDRNDIMVANGQMPNLVKDKQDNLHLVYGSGDSILYMYSVDHGKTFSKPSLISILPELAASHSRGPQITATTSGLTVLACNESGDIFSFNKTGSSDWVHTSRVNDADTTAKENLMALGGDGEIAFAVWVDLRGNGQNKIYGAKTNDGGKTWTKNIMIYESPDSTICECCKPSIVVKGNNVYVMFRNWLQGNRDLYLTQSTDGGNSFGKAEKLGTGSWKLNGCPMDGGGLAVNENNEVQTVWRRESTVYSAVPGKTEKEIGEGSGCTIESVNGKNVYAWSEKGNIIVLKPQGQKKMLGKGSNLVLKSLNNEHVICVWDNDDQVHASVIEL